MIGKLDIQAAFNYVWKSPMRNEILIKWGVLGIVYLAASMVAQFGINIISYMDDGSGVGMVAGGVLILLVYVFLMIIAVFSYGAGVNNYIKIAQSLKAGNRDAVATDSSMEFKKALINGIKMTAVLLYYYIPYIIVLVLAIFSIIAFSSQGDNMTFEQGGPIFIIAFIIFMLFVVAYNLYVYWGVYPATLKLAEEEGFKSALNVSRTFEIMRGNFRNYMWLVLANLIVGFIALLLWVASIASIIICIGIILIPMSYGWMFMVQSYINAHLIAQANN